MGGLKIEGHCTFTGSMVNVHSFIKVTSTLKIWWYCEIFTHKSSFETSFLFLFCCFVYKGATTLTSIYYSMLATGTQVIVL